MPKNEAPVAASPPAAEPVPVPVPEKKPIPPEILDEVEAKSVATDFIYGGPWIRLEKPAPFIDSATPINLQLQGTFKKSFAYSALKERLPVILTKIIDHCSRDSSKLSSGGGDVTGYIKYISKLKSDLVTNKKFDMLTVDSEDTEMWNDLIEKQEYPKYFHSPFLFTECYVYRRLKEGIQLNKLGSFDPFEEQKTKSFTSSLEAICLVAEKMEAAIQPLDKEKRKQEFITLLKLAAWANKCDMSLSAGADSPQTVDPLQMILDYKDKLIVDDSAKIADQIQAKAEALRKQIAAMYRVEEKKEEEPVEGEPEKKPAKPPVFKFQCSCHRLATLAGMDKIEPPGAAEEPTTEEKDKKEVKPERPRLPCPAKMTLPQMVQIDIVCDNAGFELFADLCLAHFLIAQKIVQRVRFRLKNMPWYVSDATIKDFRNVVKWCASSDYNQMYTPPPKPPPEAKPEKKGGKGKKADVKKEEPKVEPPPEPRPLTAEALRKLGTFWQTCLDNGTFLLLDDDYWTTPHTYNQMKTKDPALYRKLQFAVAVIFKGDLNYRKLIADTMRNSSMGFDPALQGFNPAPVVALRTVKSDVIVGYPGAKFTALTAKEPNWMNSGEYAVIQFSAKTEAIKVSDKPCEDYGTTCFSVVCPVHGEPDKFDGFANDAVTDNYLKEVAKPKPKPEITQPLPDQPPK